MKPTVKSAGTTATERSLAALCDTTFLKLWSYPNIYTPEGRKNDRGAGKELADLLVVFGDALIVFSDKDIAFPTHPDTQVSWLRWKRRAIDASISQLHGAEKWLRERPGELYLDAECSDPFPLCEAVRSASEIHLIAVARNSAAAMRAHFEGSAGGLLFAQPNMDELLAKPFTYSDACPGKTFVHVLDEERLQLLLSELDTAPDFLAYLRFKVKLIRAGALSLIEGEEDLLAWYLEAGGGVLPEESVLQQELGRIGDEHTLLITAGLWAEYSTSEARRLRREADAVSYLWDTLIEWFSRHVLDGLVPDWTEPYVAPHEAALRTMARETRLSRRALSANFADKITSTPRDRRSSRIAFSPADSTVAFVLVIFPRSLGEPYETYRQERLALMQCYAFVCKYKYPLVRRVTVIGMEPQVSLGRSEDVLATEFPESLSEEEKAQAHEIMTEGRVLLDVKEARRTSYVDAPMRVRVPHRTQKQGRNDPCRCGSGKKHKRCCGAVAFPR